MKIRLVLSIVYGVEELEGENKLKTTGSLFTNTDKHDYTSTFQNTKPM